MRRESLVSRIGRRLRTKGVPIIRKRRRSTMKTIIIFAIAIAGALAAPQNPNDITIIKQEESNNIGVGGYHFSYEQSDGQKREETAELKNEGTDDESLDVTGSFTFTSPDGHTYRVDYTADKDGFHPTINLVK
ncbi:flexible cuticle protein 12-like [Ceratina calcarata]|uniref:Flexible cuticle protein 12-like n=1 Tax=Ceratina calcarata TaxID=156304 RepID=A0AAJ7IU94_9HYME|nr:flexible cuticle protein 12-like [Ceratina calcarata]